MILGNPSATLGSCYYHCFLTINSTQPEVSGKEKGPRTSVVSGSGWDVKGSRGEKADLGEDSIGEWRSLLPVVERGLLMYTDRRWQMCSAGDLEWRPYICTKKTTTCKSSWKHLLSWNRNAVLTQEVCILLTYPPAKTTVYVQVTIGTLDIQP